MVNPDHFRRKRRLLDSICPEPAALLEQKQISINRFDTLRKMQPERQVEPAAMTDGPAKTLNDGSAG